MEQSNGRVSTQNKVNEAKPMTRLMVYVGCCNSNYRDIFALFEQEEPTMLFGLRRRDHEFVSSQKMYQCVEENSGEM